MMLDLAGPSLVDAFGTFGVGLCTFSGPCHHLHTHTHTLPSILLAASRLAPTTVGDFFLAAAALPHMGWVG